MATRAELIALGGEQVAVAIARGAEPADVAHRRGRLGGDRPSTRPAGHARERPVGSDRERELGIDALLHDFERLLKASWAR
jgi:hypothetical protein